MPWGRFGFGGAFSSRSGLTMAMKRSKMTVIVACHFVESSPYLFLVVCCPAMLICQTYCTYMHHSKHPSKCASRFMNPAEPGGLEADKSGSQRNLWIEPGSGVFGGTVSWRHRFGLQCPQPEVWVTWRR